MQTRCLRYTFIVMGVQTYMAITLEKLSLACGRAGTTAKFFVAQASSLPSLAGWKPALRRG
ncbi:MAG: hypothetical protein ONB46_26355 [candidate division KSB1 bacterium]|nr:hypothetical protein [candidate division KSB1 bacterium]MDZ7369458.1 hypothetical protein [candidate division KSB1 bacterium]MDZ7407575.1 hypothetical protein [candidate division KSB1 bacterium]